MVYQYFQVYLASLLIWHYIEKALQKEAFPHFFHCTDTFRFKISSVRIKCLP